MDSKIHNHGLLQVSLVLVLAGVVLLLQFPSAYTGHPAYSGSTENKDYRQKLQSKMLELESIWHGTRNSLKTQLNDIKDHNNSNVSTQGEH